MSRSATVEAGMLCTFTIWGYRLGVEVEVARFTGEEDEAHLIADELARAYGKDLYAVAVMKEEPEDIVYVTHDDSSRKPSRI
jgi:hypothetical protein